MLCRNAVQFRSKPSSSHCRHMPECGGTSRGPWCARLQKCGPPSLTSWLCEPASAAHGTPGSPVHSASAPADRQQGACNESTFKMCASRPYVCTCSWLQAVSVGGQGLQAGLCGSTASRGDINVMQSMPGEANQGLSGQDTHKNVFLRHIGLHVLELLATGLSMHQHLHIPQC